MVEKVNEYFYKIPTVGLRINEHMFFVPDSFSGNIHHGIGIHVDSMKGAWVISLREAWKMVLISTVIVVRNFLQRKHV